MRFRIPICFLLLAAAVMAFAYKQESVKELIARAEASRMEDRPQLYIEAAERQLHLAPSCTVPAKWEMLTRQSLMW